MNYKVLQRPAKWIAAHRKNEYKVRLPQKAIVSGYNSGGKLKIILNGAFPFPINEGDRIYIPNLAPYTGFHIIESIDSSIQFTLTTPYQVGLSGSIVVWQCVLPTVRIYKGYKAGELVLTYNSGTIDLYEIMPYTLAAEFKPEVDFDGYLKFDICGYVKTVIETPFKGAYNPDETSYLYPYGTSIYTPKYYNKIDIVFGEQEETGAKTLLVTHYAANASITTDELNREFVDTGRQLQPLKMPVEYFGNGIAIGDYIELNLLKAKYT